ncbi:MAG: 7-cyano-7-deazaguanine synthase QueC [Planctomycetaceae bacterium]|jgi:7-cyano-7-deazaguanine synthase|nr:7-cyano-7-deazaguanine synthase QueC [Planctomycetaceae bacterium]
MNKAVVLLSGGLDSATAAAVAKADGYSLFALTLDYGQRHRMELESARRVAASLGVVRHVIMPVNLRLFGGSALTDDIDVPKDMTVDKIGARIPNTYVPARNTIFLSLALAFAETAGAGKIYIGVSGVDYSGYPDCRPEFIRAFETTANLATKAGIESSPLSAAFSIVAPLIHLSKKETIEWGLRLGVDYSLTLTCYDPSPQGLSCGRCESCRLRLSAFAAAGVPDPIPYAC